MIGKKQNAKAIAVVVFGLIVAIFLLGGGTNRVRFLASLGLVPDTLGLLSSYNFENATAVNLATEGLEAIRTIRLINWLRYPDDGGYCWLMLPKNSGADECLPAHLIQNGMYALEHSIDTLTPWKLKFIGADDGARLNLSAGHTEIDEQYRVRFVMDNNSMVNAMPQEQGQIIPKPPTTMLARPGNDAVFFRMIEIRLSEDPAEMTDGAVEGAGDEVAARAGDEAAARAGDEAAARAGDKKVPPKTITVKSTVQWRSGQEIYEISLDTIFANYRVLTL